MRGRSYRRPLVDTGVLASASRRRSGCGAGVAERSSATLGAAHRYLSASHHRRHDVVAAVAMEGAAALRLGFDPLDGGDGRACLTQLQSNLVRDFVLPNIAVFGPLVYAIEVAIAGSLILGLFTRLGSVLGALMAINLWLGLYNAPNEWPWTYMFWSCWNSFSCSIRPGAASASTLSFGAARKIFRRRAGALARCLIRRLCPPNAGLLRPRRVS